jgi:hypothetical protein
VTSVPYPFRPQMAKVDLHALQCISYMVTTAGRRHGELV